jgi:hypothetical protein
MFTILQRVKPVTLTLWRVLPSGTAVTARAEALNPLSPGVFQRSMISDMETPSCLLLVPSSTPAR